MEADAAGDGRDEVTGHLDEMEGEDHGTDRDHDQADERESYRLVHPEISSSGDRFAVTP